MCKLERACRRCKYITFSLSVSGQSVVSKPSDEAQTDAAGGGGESAAAGGRRQQELAPRQQVEAGDGATEPVVGASTAAATAATATAAAAAGVPATPSAEAHARAERRLFVRFGNLRDTIHCVIQNYETNKQLSVIIIIIIIIVHKSRSICIYR